MVVSFNVVSLFANVPVELVICVAKDHMLSDDDLHSHTNLKIPEISDVLVFCLRDTYLSFRGELYQQKHGTGMSSPITWSWSLLSKRLFHLTTQNSNSERGT